MSFYLYAETAFHHEGSKDYLIGLVKEAKKAGVHGVKFQILVELTEFMSPFHSAFEDAKSWILSAEEWTEVFNYTKRIGLDIIAMPLDLKAFDLISTYDIKYIEIHSVSFKDEKLFSALDGTRTPVMFGVGGRTMEEINAVVKKYHNRDLTLMMGFQSFPTDLVNVKLTKIKQLCELYSGCAIGYADHSSFDDEMAITSNEYAYLLGARVFEKHITKEEGKERIDFQSAIGAKKMKIIKQKLEYLEIITYCDDGNLFDLNDKELDYRNREKTPVASRDIFPGEIMTNEMVNLKMIDSTENINSLKELVGLEIKTKILKNESFFEKDLI